MCVCWADVHWCVCLYVAMRCANNYLVVHKCVQSENILKDPYYIWLIFSRLKIESYVHIVRKTINDFLLLLLLSHFSHSSTSRFAVIQHSKEIYILSIELPYRIEYFDFFLFLLEI